MERKAKKRKRSTITRKGKRSHETSFQSPQTWVFNFARGQRKKMGKWTTPLSFWDALSRSVTWTEQWFDENGAKNEVSQGTEKGKINFQLYFVPYKTCFANIKRLNGTRVSNLNMFFFIQQQVVKLNPWLIHIDLLPVLRYATSNLWNDSNGS